MGYWIVRDERVSHKRSGVPGQCGTLLGHRCGGEQSQHDEEHSVFESNREHSQGMEWWGALAGHRDSGEAF